MKPLRNLPDLFLILLLVGSAFFLSALLTPTLAAQSGRGPGGDPEIAGTPVTIAVCLNSLS